ncbi:hypothetical protein SPRG_17841, partial [Saprolegnia parasitica CBS 223.65]
MGNLTRVIARSTTGGLDNSSDDDQAGDKELSDAGDDSSDSGSEEDGSKKFKTVAFASSMASALRKLSRHAVNKGFDYKYRYESSRVAGWVRVFACITHVKCPYECALVQRRDCYYIEERGKHSAAEDEETRRHGIHPSLLPRVDDLARSGLQPAPLLRELKRAYKRDPAMLQRLPTRLQLSNRAAYL